MIMDTISTINPTWKYDYGHWTTYLQVERHKTMIMDNIFTNNPSSNYDYGQYIYKYSDYGQYIYN